MATPDNNNNTSFPNTIYQEVKDWAAEQEAFERENKAPAPLNDVERAFLKSLRPQTPLPEIEQDCVSLLSKYWQIVPSGKKDPFVYGIHPSTNARGSPQWTCTLELNETSVHEPSIKSFPAAGYGLDITGCCPSFEKKRDAKQYAAKCAVDWLDKKSLLPSSLRVAVVPQKPLPVLQNQPAKRPSEGTNGVLSPPPKRKSKGATGSVDVNDENLPATQRVSTLCQSMGLRAPSYVLTHADPSVNFIFNGHPDFGDDEDSFGFSEGLGRITAVSGRDNARQEIAEQLLPHLLSMHRERTADYESHSISTRS